MDSGDVMELSKSRSFKIPSNSFQDKRTSERERPKLESVPIKFGPNEITAGSLDPLASNMQLSDPRHRFQRLPPWKLQGLQRRRVYWGRPMQESGTDQHPGTRGQESDGAFLAVSSRRPAY